MWTFFLLDRENELTLKHRNRIILIVIKCRNSLLDHIDTVFKLIEKKMQESITTKLWMNMDECKKSNSTILNVGQLRWRRTSSILNAFVDWKMDISSGKRWRTEEKASILLESELSSSLPVLSINSRTFRKCYQSCIARQCTATRRFYRVFYQFGNGKELRSIVNHGLIAGGVNLRMGREAVFFTIVNPMDNQDGLGETLCDL